MIYTKPVKLFRGFDDIFQIPHSRHTEIRREDILAHKSLRLLSESDESGVYAVSGLTGRKIFVTGHSEYDANTLRDEYFRDLDKGIPCLLYTSDAADDLLCVDLGGRRII